MKKIIFYPFIVLLIASMAGCKRNSNLKNAEILPVTSPAKTVTTPVQPVNNVPTTGCTPQVSSFFAGKHILVGNVRITNDLTNLYVTLTTENGWVMSESHVYAGPLSGAPKTKTGNPKIGNFPFKSTHSPAVNAYTYSIPLNKLGADKCIVVATHAVVSKINSNGSITNQETAWGAGTQFNSSGSWASYIPYCTCAEGNSGTVPTENPTTPPVGGTDIDMGGN